MANTCHHCGEPIDENCDPSVLVLDPDGMLHTCPCVRGHDGPCAGDH